MNPLYRNDRAGEFPDSWYAATTDLPARRPALRGSVRADVCVVGAGYTGLTAALRLAQAGRRVIVLDAHRAGFGASGRNGGQVGTGYNWPQSDLARKVGVAPARALWEIAEQAKADLHDLVIRHAPHAHWKPGVAYGTYKDSACTALHAEADFLQKTYGYDKITPLDRAGLRDIVGTDSYAGGWLDHGAAHIHPLRYAVGLACAAEAAGVTIHEGSEVHHIAKGSPARVQTGRGYVTADQVILAGNGYMPGIVAPVASRVMPINSFIGATPPLDPDLARQVLSQDIAVADSKFVVNYYRLSEDNRLLFGGRESYGLSYPADMGGPLQARMEHLFPQLAGIGFDYVWGGTLGITMTRLPALQRIGTNIMSAAGFSGHGVALSGMAGRVMAEAIIGQTDQFDVMRKLPVPQFPGGARLRAPLLTLAMTWFALRDRLGL